MSDLDAELNNLLEELRLNGERIEAAKAKEAAEAAEAEALEDAEELEEATKPKRIEHVRPKVVEEEIVNPVSGGLTQEIKIDIERVVGDHMKMVKKIQNNVDIDREEIQKTVDICLDRIEQDQNNVKSVYVEALVTAQTAKVNAQNISLRTLDSTTKLLFTLQSLIPKEGLKRTVKAEDLVLPPLSPEQDGA